MHQKPSNIVKLLFVLLLIFFLKKLSFYLTMADKEIYGYHYRASSRLRYQRFENRLESGPHFTQVCPSPTKIWCLTTPGGAIIERQHKPLFKQAMKSLHGMVDKGFYC